MGNTHFRSDVRESGSRTASFSTIAGGTISGTTISGTTLSATGTVTGTGGVIAGSGKYFKLGAIYIITGNPTAFTNTAINAAATNAAGVSLATSVPRGSLFLNASSNVDATHGIYFKVEPGTWAVVTTGSKF
jgi:hypothetical protein